MRLAIFGATGFIGSAVVEEALAAGHTVQALVRDPERAPNRDRLDGIQGDVLDPTAVDRVVRGSNAVISALGIPRGQKVSADFLAEAMKTILAGMQRNQVRRIVAISGAGITLPGERKPFPHNLASALVRRLARNAVEAKQREYGVLSASELDWTAVRPTRVVNGAASAHPRISTAARDLGLRVTRSDLARFMVTAVESRQFIRQAPFISS